MKIELSLSVLTTDNTPVLLLPEDNFEFIPNKLLKYKEYPILGIKTGNKYEGFIKQPNIVIGYNDLIGDYYDKEMLLCVNSIYNISNLIKEARKAIKAYSYLTSPKKAEFAKDINFKRIYANPIMDLTISDNPSLETVKGLKLAEILSEKNIDRYPWSTNI